MNATQDLAMQITHCITLDEHELNTSDHLPIILSLSLLADEHPKEIQPISKPKINWREAIRTNSTAVYASEVDSKLSHLVGKDYTDLNDIQRDIHYLAESLKKTAEASLPHLQAKTTHRQVHDSELKKLCSKSRRAFWAWQQAGRPGSGTLFESRKATKRAVQDRLNKCKASKERQRLAKMDHMLTARPKLLSLS